MQLGRLTLNRFCQHESLLVDFPVGITGIVGANGSGKSTIARALQFALLGESGNPGKKEDDLNWSAEKTGGTGTVELTFTKDGTEGKIARSIQAARASLKFGDINERSVSGTNRELMKLINRSKQIVENIVFVMQGQIESILFSRPSDRKKDMHALFGIDRTEPIRVMLRDEIGSLNLSPLDDRIAQLKSRIETEIDPLLRSTADDRTKLNGEIAGLDEASMKTVVSTYEAAANMQAHVAGMEAELHRLQSQPPPQVDSLKAELEALRAEIDSHIAPIDSAKQKLATLNSEQQVRKTRDALVAELVNLQRLMAQPAPTPPNFGSELVEQGEQQIVEARAEIAPKQSFVRAFDGKGDTICPTCQQPVKDAGALAQQMKVEIAEREQIVASVAATVKAARAALTAFESEKYKYETSVAQATQRAATVEATLKDMPEVRACDEQMIATMRGAIDQFNQQTVKLTQMERTYNETAQQKTAIDAQIGSLASSIEKARQQLSSNVTDVDYRAAKTSLDFLIATRVKLAELEGRFKQLQDQRASSIKELQGLEEQATQIAGLKKYQSLCERARTVLHYDNLPRLAMQKYLGLLNAKLNQFLSVFNVPFTCTIKNDLSIMCNMPDVGEKDANRLSGGQKVMLGIAFRVAVYNMFASDLGFMVLDEPTNMLDQDRITCVVEMLETVGAYARNSRMQLVVITHEQELARAFDGTIML